MIDIPALLDQLSYRYPSLLVDAITEHQPGERLVAIKNVTVNEEFFQGHFPGVPLMPGVLMLETLAQAATILVLEREGSRDARVRLRGVSDARFRRQVVPGDQLRLEVTLGRERASLRRVDAAAYVGDQVVAEAALWLAITRAPVRIHPAATVQAGARIGSDSVVEAHAVIGREVTIGRGCRVGASAVIDGPTIIGDETEVFPFASIGQIPQDLKYRGEETHLVIGRRNIFREFVTIHRGTKGGGGVTRIGDRNLFMAYAHVAHDCHIGDDTIIGHAATLGGHVTVEDFATISAGSGVHQFCRVGRHAFVGGYSVVTKDALPFSRIVGNRARIYGLNTVGLARRGMSSDAIARLRRAFRYLLQSNKSHALAQIARDPSVRCAEVDYLVEFIRTSKRGVLLRRPVRRAEEAVADE